MEEGATTLTMPCGHTYHRECLIPWLEEHNTCPPKSLLQLFGEEGGKNHGLGGCSLDWEGSPWIRSSRATQTEQKQIMAATIWNGEQPEEEREEERERGSENEERAGRKNGKKRTK